MKMSVCIDAVYSGRNFQESMKEIKRLGVKAFEFWSWWDKEKLKEISLLKDELGLEAAAFCTKFISLVDAAQRESYLDALKESINIAKKLDCKTLISQVGNDMGTSREEQKKNLIRGLKSCAPILEAEDITLVIEPLNTAVDHKGYFLWASGEAFEIIDRVNSPRVKVLFDIYHQQITEGNLIKNITENIHKIGHFHAAGNPGRHELYYGEINYPSVFKAIDESGYEGYTGLEYFPLEAPEKGIKAFI